MGGKESGISGHIRGWHIGARVTMVYNKETGEDEVHIRLTSGSSGNMNGRCLGKFTAKDLE